MARRTHYTAPASEGDARVPKAQRFATRLNHFMLKRGWRQSQLARAAEKQLPDDYVRQIREEGKQSAFGRHLISSYVRGVHLPNQIHLEALAKSLGVGVNDLMPEEEAVIVGRKPDVLSFEMDGVESARIKIDMILPVDTGLQIMQLVRSAQNEK